MLKTMSYKYLLSNFVNSAVWLAYSIKVQNDDLIIINVIATLITGLFFTMFLYVKIKIGRYYELLMMALAASPVVVLPYTDYVTTNYAGIMATSLSVFAYAVSLDTISMTLKTRNS